MEFPPPPPPDSEGTLINNRYRIQKLLGRGGFGQTYLAHDTQCFNHPCVLKEFAPANRAEYSLQKARQLFEREARALYEIDHPQIPQFLAWFIDRDRLFLVQEYIAGKTYAQLLRQRQQQQRTFSETEVIRLLMDVLPILQYLHQRQMVHRDISPDNIMQPDRQGALPILIDFGLVKQTLTQLQSDSHGKSEAVSFVGKFGYAPAEQMRMGQCFPSSDLYALGVTALVLLTGQEPRLLIDHESMGWNWRDYISLNPTLTQVLERMLQEKPKHRYQTAEAVMISLQPIATTAFTSQLTTMMVPPWEIEQPIATPTDAPSNLTPEFLQRCLQELTRCIGPIADFVLENVQSQRPQISAAQLIDVLSLEIPDPVQAEAFKQRLIAVAPAVPRSLHQRRSQSMPQSSTQPATTLSPDFLDRCQQMLARCIGPVAGMIVDDLLIQNPQMTPAQLIEAIVDEIPDVQQAQAFRQSMK